MTSPPQHTYTHSHSLSLFDEKTASERDNGLLNTNPGVWVHSLLTIEEEDLTALDKVL